MTALAPVQGEQSYARTLTTGFIGEHAAILVVGVGDDQHETGAGAKLAQRLLERGRAAVDPQRPVVGGSGNGRGGGDLGRTEVAVKSTAATRVRIRDGVLQDVIGSLLAIAYDTIKVPPYRILR